MSELIDTRANQENFRWQLLTTVSALALLTLVGAAGDANAQTQDRPTVWVEIGGQLESMTARKPFAPAFTDSLVAAGFVNPTVVQRSPRHSIGGEAKITFAPEGTDWTFSASVLYGRSSGNRHLHEQTYAIRSKYLLGVKGPVKADPKFNNLSDTTAKHNESHTVLDFQVGRDVGVGMFGPGGQSVLGAGLRFAQFSDQSSVRIQGRPNVTVTKPPFLGGYYPQYEFDQYDTTGHASRSFRGLGPSLSWDASAPVLHNPEGADVTFDWGLNAALLFGRQRADVDHQTVHMHNIVKFGKKIYPVYSPHTGVSARARSVIVPNLGAFAGLSLKFPNAKVSLGYRADFFFGAVDDGIDARETSDRSFHGPFAKISIGLGG
ncbi:MAG TPA: hypothetical protein VL026_11485 [Rhizomicrobium sp.]|nr:hypothetical protein [Rhizomicrobium sp.]